jgi:hypothetical protein
MMAGTIADAMIKPNAAGKAKTVGMAINPVTATIRLAKTAKGNIRSVVQARTMTSAKAGAFLTNIAAANTWLMIGAATA